MINDKYDILIEIVKAYENGEMSEEDFEKARTAELKWLNTGEY